MHTCHTHTCTTVVIVNPYAVTSELDALDQWCLIRICGIKWNDFVTNEEVRQRKNQLPLTSIMRKRRLGLFGHVARLYPANDNKRVLSAPTVITD